MTNQIEDIKRAAYYEAVRIAHKREPNMGAVEFAALHLNVAHDMLHRAMMEELAPLLKFKADAYKLMLQPRFLVNPDGSFQALPMEPPEALKPHVAEIDRMMDYIQQKYTEAAKCATLGESRRCMPA